MCVHVCYVFMCVGTYNSNTLAEMVVSVVRNMCVNRQEKGVKR